MAARSKARKRAVDVLYEADVRGTEAVSTLRRAAGPGRPAGPGVRGRLVEGVAGRLAEIDELLGTHAEGWTVERMPPVDRAILRLALYELLWRDDVPDAVVIDEAVELAKSLSTDESPRFVNGVLGRVLREQPAPRAGRTTPRLTAPARW